MSLCSVHTFTTTYNMFITTTKDKRTMFYGNVLLTRKSARIQLRGKGTIVY